MTAVIVDDDPTGVQTLRDVVLIFGVDDELLRESLARGSSAVCVLTNSRALSPEQARHANARVADLLRRDTAAPIVVSRGDSTLRGHLAVETEALLEGLGAGDGEVRKIFVPAFVEAGRTTRGGRHFVEIDGVATPVAETPFARDARFPFRSSELPDYLEEIGAVAAADEVRVLTLDVVRRGPDAVSAALRGSPGSWTAIDAATIEDIDAIAAGVERLHREGIPVLVRCAPSLVRALVGQQARPALTDDELTAAFPARTGHGLVVVGSHVPQTTRQLAALKEGTGLTHIAAPLDVLLHDDAGARVALAGDIVAALAMTEVVLSTPRSEVRDPSVDGELARRMSDSLNEIVREVRSRAPLAWVIAKGGITSHETAATGLGVRAATVIGQLFDSKVSVIRPDRAADPSVIGLPYVIFPGNVGGDHDLAIAVERMRALVASGKEEQ